MHEKPPKPRIVGRSSSHFTRVTRIFARGVGVEIGFQVVPDLMSKDPSDYAGNPSLKLPILQAPSGTWFGALNICRELSRLSALDRRVAWPEDAREPLLANAQELTLQAMATEVALIMAQVSKSDTASGHLEKMKKSLENTLSWLEESARAAIAALPKDRDLSFLEVTLFCLVTHLEFRNVLPTDPYPALGEFCRQFAERPSARDTAYAFDA